MSQKSVHSAESTALGESMTDEQPARPPLPSMPAQQAAAASPSRRRRFPVWAWIVSGVVAVGIIVAAIAIPVSIGQQQAAAHAAHVAKAKKIAAQEAEAKRLAAFDTALTSCNAGTTLQYNVMILDGGESVDLERVTKYDGITYDNLVCFLGRLGAPSSIEAEIGQTRALDGRQSDEWDGYKIEWSYHPDDGASIIVKHTD